MRLLCLPIATVAALFCAPVAVAATVSVQEAPRKFVLAAAPGETNQITIAGNGAALVVRDATAPLTAGAGCAAEADGAVRCALASGQTFNVSQVDLGDGDDTAVVQGALGLKVDGQDGNDALTGGEGDDDLDGGAGADRLEGGGGADDLDAGDGDDVVMARDGVSDEVACATGTDTAELDAEDTDDGGCETADRPLAPAGSLVDGGDSGNHYGQDKDRSFTPGETVGGVVVPAGVAAPVAGTAVGVGVKSGVIRVRRPGGRGFVALDPSRPVPVGSTLDAREGVLTLVAASDANGGEQAADFKAGKFVVRQVPGRVLTTELQVKGGGFRKVCGRRNATASSAAPVARAAGKRSKRAKRRKRRAVRKLWGSGHGRFRTRGRNSAATVRGTTWKVVDRCDGTLTKVKRGVVVVENLRTDRTKVVRAGESYLVKRPRRSRRR